MNESDPAVGRELLRDVLLNPADDTPRLIYADWLEEYGGKPHMAGFIRAQIEASAHDECYYLDINNAHVLKKSAIESFRRSAECFYAAAYHEGMDPFMRTDARVWKVEWRRGFLHSVHFTLDDISNGRAGAVCASHPVEDVKTECVTWYWCPGLDPTARQVGFIVGRAGDGMSAHDNRVVPELVEFLLAEGLESRTAPNARYLTIHCDCRDTLKDRFRRAAVRLCMEGREWIYKNS